MAAQLDAVRAVRPFTRTGRLPTAPRSRSDSDTSSLRRPTASSLDLLQWTRSHLRIRVPSRPPSAQLWDCGKAAPGRGFFRGIAVGHRCTPQGAMGRRRQDGVHRLRSHAASRDVGGMGPGMARPGLFSDLWPARLLPILASEIRRPRRAPQGTRPGERPRRPRREALLDDLAALLEEEQEPRKAASAMLERLRQEEWLPRHVTTGATPGTKHRLLPSSRRCAARVGLHAVTRPPRSQLFASRFRDLPAPGPGVTRPGAPSLQDAWFRPARCRRVHACQASP